MTIETLDLNETKSFSSFFLDYLNDKNELRSYYGLRPGIDSAKEQIEKKSFSSEKRNVLSNALKSQYDGFTISEAVNKNIDLLKNEKTFTITTGHQLNICTGPFYFIYKIVTVVNACKELKQQYPDYNFVPVYWMASEDHDFDEINHFNLFGKKIQWNSEQTGAVGRFKTNGLSEVLNEMPEKVELFEKAYNDFETLAGSVRYYVNELFGQYGLIVVDGDDKSLKSQFSDVIVDDLTSHKANELVEETSRSLNQLGYKTQVFPRNINLFYLKDNMRERIVREGENYGVKNTEIQFSEDEIKELAVNEPELFSPNVVLRPLYQETILPNLAYAGGPAEVVYWMQLKPVFDHYGVAFPMLMPRNFALYIGKPAQKKINKFGLTLGELFLDTKSLKEAYVKRTSNNEVSLNSEMDALKSVFDLVTNKASAIDGSLSGFIGAEFNKAHKSLDNIQKRLKKTEEKKHETALNQIEALKSKLFPNGGLQERNDNFLNVYINNPNLIDNLLNHLEPFNYKFFVLKED